MLISSSRLVQPLSWICTSAVRHPRSSWSTCYVFYIHSMFMQYIQNTKGAVCRFHAPWSARQLLPILEAMKANKNVVQSGYMCLFKYLQHGYYYYRSSSIGDSLSSFYVCEGSKNLSDWTFSSWPISLEQQNLVLQELDVAKMVHSKCQNTEVPRNRLTLRDGTSA